MMIVTKENVVELIDSDRLQKRVRGNRWVTVARQGEVAWLNGRITLLYVAPGGKKGKLVEDDFASHGELGRAWRGLDKINDASYETGYREGESSGNVSWIMALDELPFDISGPADVVDFFNKLKASSSTMPCRCRNCDHVWNEAFSLPMDLGIFSNTVRQMTCPKCNDSKKNIIVEFGK